MIPRPGHIAKPQHLLKINPVVAPIGARQIGKTTLGERVGSGSERAVIVDLLASDELGSFEGRIPAE